MDVPLPQACRHQPQQLDNEERRRVETLILAGHAKGMSPQQVCIKTMDDGNYIASPRTFSRIASHLRQQGRLGTTRPTRVSPRPKNKRPAPVVVAEGINDAWSWDITDLPGQYVGQCFKAYVVCDLYSRKIVAVRVEQRECKKTATAMFRNAFDHAIPKVVHADSGAAMIADTVVALFDAFNVVESHSRPRVSNDNPYSESVFSTMKRAESWPKQFESLEHAREWVTDWVEYYNKKHYHSGIGFYTPEMVYDGSWIKTRRQRQCVLDNHYAQHPLRYRKPPQAPTLAAEIGINLPTRENAKQ